MANSSEKMKRENYLDTHLILGTFIVLIIGCVAHIKIVNEYDLLASSVNVLQLLIYEMGTLHICYYQIRNETVHCLVRKIQEAFRFASNTGHFTMEEPSRVSKQRSAGWTMLCITAATCWFILAMAQGDDPVPVWAPVNLRESPYYEIEILLQFTGQFMIGTLAGCFGSFYVSVLSLFRYQFVMLSCSLEHVAPLAALKTRRRVHNEYEKTPSAIESRNCTSNPGNGGTKIDRQCECCTEEFKRFFATFEKRRFNNALTPLEIRVYEEELYDTLKDCIVHHQDIVKLIDAIQDFFSLALLIRFFLSTLMLCFTIYSSSKFTENKDFNLADMRFISLMEYYLVAVGEMFIFCYVADHLSRTSMTIPDVAFERLPWHGGGVTKKFISTLKIFHLSVTKPTSLRTPFYVVNLDVLRTILRASFSFYTLLRRLQSN